MKSVNFPLFLFLMIMGVLIVFYSSSWLSVWLGLEMNLLGFLPVLLNQPNLNFHEMIMKYYLVSVLSSLFILYFSLWEEFPWDLMINSKDKLLIDLALGLKLGAAPFHFWFISFMKSISPFNGYLLLTLQKFPILYLMSLNSNIFVLMFFLFNSGLVGMWGGFSQLSVMKILGYSSLSHLAWLLAVLMKSSFLWMFYFFVYSFMLIPIFLLMSQQKFYQSSLHFSFSKDDFFLFSLAVLSLAGLPPLLGFFPKFFILNAFSDEYTLCFFLIFISVGSLYYYARLLYGFVFLYHMISFQPMVYWKWSILLVLNLSSPLLLIFF